jgi:hypothetical protein
MMPLRLRLRMSVRLLVFLINLKYLIYLRLSLLIRSLRLEMKIILLSSLEQVMK